MHRKASHFVLKRPGTTLSVASSAATPVVESSNKNSTDSAVSRFHSQLPISVLIARTQSLLFEHRRLAQEPTLLHAARTAVKQALDESGSERLRALLNSLDECLTAEPKHPAKSSERCCAARDVSIVLPVAHASSAQDFHRLVGQERGCIVEATPQCWKEVITSASSSSSTSSTSTVADWIDQLAETPAAAMKTQAHCLALASALLHVTRIASSVVHESERWNRDKSDNNDSEDGLPSLSSLATILGQCFCRAESSPALLSVMKSASVLAAKILRDNSNSNGLSNSGMNAPLDDDSSSDIPDAIRIAVTVFGSSVFDARTLACAMQPGFVVQASIVAGGGRVDDDAHLVRLFAKSPRWVLRMIIENNSSNSSAIASSTTASNARHSSVLTERETAQLLSIFQFTVKRAALSALVLRPPSDDLAGIPGDVLQSAFGGNLGSSDIVRSLSAKLDSATVLRVAQQRPSWQAWLKHAFGSVVMTMRQERHLQQQQAQNNSNNSNNLDDDFSLLVKLRPFFATVDLARLPSEHRPLAVLMRGAPTSWREALTACSKSMSRASEFRQVAAVATLEWFWSNSLKTQSAATAATRGFPLLALQRLTRALDPLSPTAATKLLRIAATSSATTTAEDQWHAALQLHDTVLSRSASVVTSDDYQNTLTAIVSLASHKSRLAAQVGSVAATTLNRRWADALRVFGANAAVPAMRHVATAVAFSALVCGSWDRALDLLLGRTHQGLLSYSSSSARTSSPSSLESGEQLLMSQDPVWRQAVESSGAPRAVISAVYARAVQMRKTKQQQQQQSEVQQRAGFHNSSMHKLRAQLEKSSGSNNWNSNVLGNVTTTAMDADSLIQAHPYKAQGLLFALNQRDRKKKTMKQTHLQKQQQQQQERPPHHVGQGSLIFDLLRKVYRPSANAFAAVLNDIHSNSNYSSSIHEQQNDMDAIALVAQEPLVIEESTAASKTRTSPASIATTMGNPRLVLPPPSPAAWVDAIELFQDAWMASERGGLSPTVYLGALQFCREPYDTPIEVTRAVVQATKKSPALMLDPRLAAALIRTAAAARLWSDVIDCFFLLLEQSSAVPDRASIAVVLTACKQIDTRHDRLLAEVKVYLEATLEDSFAVMGDVLHHVQWFRSTSTTIVRLELRCGEFGSMTHVSRCNARTSNRSSGEVDVDVTSLDVPQKRILH